MAENRNCSNCRHRNEDKCVDSYCNICMKLDPYDEESGWEPIIIRRKPLKSKVAASSTSSNK